MFASRCCGPMKNINGVLVFGHGNIGRIVSSIGRVPYSSEKCCKTCKCCKCGRNITEPMEPPNNDPYRIKVSEITVPPLPASNCKELLNIQDGLELLPGPETSFRSNCTRNPDLFYNSFIASSDFRKGKPEEKKLRDIVNEVIPKLGYHGRKKYQYAFHEPWRPLDRIALLDQAEKEDMEIVNEHTTSKNKLIH